MSVVCKLYCDRELNRSDDAAENVLLILEATGSLKPTYLGTYVT